MCQILLETETLLLRRMTKEDLPRLSHMLKKTTRSTPAKGRSATQMLQLVKRCRGVDMPHDVYSISKETFSSLFSD